MPPLGFLPPSIAMRGRDDPETVKLTGIYHNLVAAGRSRNLH
jgi:PKHD-type hydroxylase C-terminal domain